MISKSLDNRFSNIDKMIDTLIEVQRENGEIPTMREALFDPVTKERINIFRRERLEKEGVDLSKYGNNDSVVNNCKGCNKCEKGISNIARGVFVYSEDDLAEEDSDEEYVCEYCTKIGYDGSYRPDVCDICDDCDGCAEYLGDTCDGCKYSALYNGGSSYGESSDEDVEMRQEDSSLLEEVENGVPDYEIEYPDGNFTIMDY